MPQLALASAKQGPTGNTGSTGAPGAAGVGAQGLWQPGDNGLLAANSDPRLAGSNVNSLTAGIVYLLKLRTAQAGPVGTVHIFPRSPAAVGLSNTYLGVYSIGATTATLLGQTADVSTLMQGAGATLAFPLTAATASQAAGTALYVAVLFGAATTVPTFLAPTIGKINYNQTASSPYWSATSGTGQTALPSTITLSGLGAGAALPFVGLS